MLIIASIPDSKMGVPRLRRGVVRPDICGRATGPGSPAGPFLQRYGGRRYSRSVYFGHAVPVG